jgi:serine/threonine-protein phosphatase 4 regulatory subunit 1
MSSVFSSEQPPWLSHFQNHELSLEDLTVDEGLTPLQKVERYVSSPIPLQRLVHLKQFAGTAKEHGLDVTRTVLLPLIGLLTMDDKVAVRQELPTQIILISKHFVAASSSSPSPSSSSVAVSPNNTTSTTTATSSHDDNCHQHDEGYGLFLESLLPCIARLLHDQREEVRQAASEALVEAAQLVRPPDVGRHVLTLVLRLAHDDENDSLRMTAAWLLNELSPRLGPELSRQFLMPECVSLAEDPDPRVRRHVAWNLLRIFSVLRAPKQLLDAFLALCEDDNYRVRRACTETIVDLCRVLAGHNNNNDSSNRNNDSSSDHNGGGGVVGGGSGQHQHQHQQYQPSSSSSLHQEQQEAGAEVLLKAFTQLLGDSSRTVRTGARLHLGAFISTLQGGQVTAEVVQAFVEMADDHSNTNGLKQQCAYQFPAVCLTLGPGR